MTTKDEILPKNIEVDVLQNIAVLLINAHGTSHMHRYLQPLDGHVNVYRFHQGEQQNELVTYYIGKYGACPAAIRWLQPVHDSHSTVLMMADQCFPNLGAIISVGVACGIRSKAQLCDVLVSSKVINYDYDITIKKYLPKGEAIIVSSPIIKLFTQPVQWPNNAINKYLKSNRQQVPNVKSGTILSGPYVVYYQATNRLVKNFADEVIGIEIDGANLFTENQPTTVNTVIVKAVCDFGDGKKIKVNQPTAALLAADLVYTGLSCPQAPEILKG